MSVENKIHQPERISVMRSEIHLAAYNPRKISPEARKKLKANLKQRGLMGGIVWNATTGNLVSGHQRVSIMDEVNRYNAETQEHDYPIWVDKVELDERAEKEQNLFMNNKAAQGEFDDDTLALLLQDIDYSLAGFDDFDVSLYGITTQEVSDLIDHSADSWSKEDVVGTEDDKDEKMAAIDAETKATAENTAIDRSTNFYEDTKENQLARHNEVEKIKDRIKNNSDFNNDRGALSYVIISFDSPQEKMLFMQEFGFEICAKNIDGKTFLRKLEFGEEDEEA